MIEIKNISKKFDKIEALKPMSSNIAHGSVFGIIGSNGAGKSTFLRLLAGILKSETGEILIDGQNVYENPSVKERCFYISDEQFFFANSNPSALMRFYRNAYPKFSLEKYLTLMEGFSLDQNRKINTFSKGMKKQVSVIMAIASGAEYIFADETFDGLDPVARQAVKSLFASAMLDYNMTPIIASHNLREIEDICDHVGLLHKGGLLLSRDIGEMKTDLHKIQCAFPSAPSKEEFTFDIINFVVRGTMLTITARGEIEKIEAEIKAKSPIFYESLPLTLEEIFITETEVAGYDINKLLF